MPTSPRKRQQTPRKARRSGQKRPVAEPRRKLTPAQFQRRRWLGAALIVLGVAVFFQHLIAHMGFFTLFSRGWDDIVAGYPVAALLVVGGGTVLAKT